MGLYNRLKKEAWLDPWIDKEKILAGQDWDAEIRRAVKASDIIIVCLSKSSATKEGYVQKEIRLALDIADEKPDGTIFIIPLKLQKCDVPERLNKWQWIDYYDDEESALNWLLYSLNVRAKGLGVARKIKPIQFRSDLKPKESEFFAKPIQRYFHNIFSVIDESITRTIFDILSPFKSDKTSVIFDLQKLLGGVVEFSFLLIFLYATTIQLFVNFSFIAPTILVPPLFQNVPFSIIIAVAGCPFVLTIMLTELLGETHFFTWNNMKAQTNKMFLTLVISTLVITIIFAVFLSFPRLLNASVFTEQFSSSLNLFGAFAQSMLIIPLLITTALLFRGVVGILVLVAFCLYILRLPVALLRILI